MSHRTALRIIIWVYAWHAIAAGVYLLDGRTLWWLVALVVNAATVAWAVSGYEDAE